MGLCFFASVIFIWRPQAAAPHTGLKKHVVNISLDYPSARPRAFLGCNAARWAKIALFSAIMYHQIFRKIVCSVLQCFLSILNRTNEPRSWFLHETAAWSARAWQSILSKSIDWPCIFNRTMSCFDSEVKSNWDARTGLFRLTHPQCALVTAYVRMPRDMNWIASKTDWPFV